MTDFIFLGVIRKSMKKLLALALGVSILAGCSTQSFTLGGSASTQPQDVERQHFFVYGIAQQRNIDAAEICGGVENVAKVESTLTGVDAALQWLTFYIYTPRTAKVYCVQ